jgi:hypothetical protein
MSRVNISFDDYSDRPYKINPRTDILRAISWKENKDKNRYDFYVVYHNTNLSYAKYLKFTIKYKEISFRQPILSEVKDLLDKKGDYIDIRILDMKLNNERNFSLLYSNSRFTLEELSTGFLILIPLALHDNMYAFLFSLMFKN